MQPSKICLHVGHGKTASSYLQSVLAGSIPSLDAAGFCYPITDVKKAKAASGGTTGGNLERGADAWTTMLDLADTLDGRKLLVSSEFLFQQLFTGLDATIAQKHPGVPVSVLLFVRNPLENAATIHNQMVKTGKEARKFEDVLRNSRFDVINSVIKFAQACKSAGYSLTVHNYSKVRENLIQHLAEWLQVPESALVLPPRAIVNRSLDRSELAIQRVLNKYLPGESSFLALNMVEHIGPVSKGPPQAPRDVLENYKGKVAVRIREANDYFERELYTEEDIAPYHAEPDSKSVHLSEEQLEVLMRVIAARMKRLSREAQRG